MTAQRHALPGVEERETWGKPTFRVAGRLFLTLASDGSSATMKASLEAQTALVATDPTVYSVAAHVGRRGGVDRTIDRCDPDELSLLIIDAWNQCAPRRLADQPESRRTRSDSSEVVETSGPRRKTRR